MQAKAEFKGTVIGVHVWVGNEEIRLIGANGTWSGERAVKDEPLVIVTMRFVAPEFTDWALEVKFDGVTAVKESGTSVRQETKKDWKISRPPQGGLVAVDVT